MLNSLMTSMTAREDVFTLGPLSHIIAREYTQLTHVKQRRRVFTLCITFQIESLLHLCFSLVKIK